MIIREPATSAENTAFSTVTGECPYLAQSFRSENVASCGLEQGKLRPGVPWEVGVEPGLVLNVRTVLGDP